MLECFQVKQFGIFEARLTFVLEKEGEKHKPHKLPYEMNIDCRKQV
jgi:hypothetical protein